MADNKLSNVRSYSMTLNTLHSVLLLRPFYYRYSVDQSNRLWAGLPLSDSRHRQTMFSSPNLQTVRIPLSLQSAGYRDILSRG
jgi:hypothetical protein